MSKKQEKKSGQNRKNQEQEFTGSKKLLASRKKLAYSLDLQGKTNKEIAELLGVSLSTVEKDLHHCREHARDWFSEIGSTDRYLAFVDATLNLDAIQKDLWRLATLEKDPMKAVKLLSKIADNSIKKANMYKATESYLTNFYFKQKDLTKEYKAKQEYMDLTRNRI